MSDFERIFGAGADIDCIIADINHDYFSNLAKEKEEDEAWENTMNPAFAEMINSNDAPCAPPPRRKITFKTYQDASNWSMINGGKAFKRHQNGGFVEV